MKKLTWLYITPSASTFSHSAFDGVSGMRASIAALMVALSEQSILNGWSSSYWAQPHGSPPSPWAWPSSSAAARKSVESARTVYSILV